MAKSIKYCTNCGEKIDIKAEICPKCGVRQPSITASGGRSKIAAGYYTYYSVGPLSPG